MSHPKLTQERLKKLLHYEPSTGVFTWIVAPANQINVGDRAGCLNGHGYRHICIDRKHYKASRLAWLYIEGYSPEFDVDHQNRIRDDDRWCNLRHVSRQCNTRNCGMRKNNSSGVTGVSWYKRASKWRAQIRVNRKSLHLGSFESKTEAVEARWNAEKKYGFPNCNSSSSAYLYLKKCGAI